MTQFAYARTIFFAAILIFLIPLPGFSTADPENKIRLVSPAADRTVVGKKPLIKCLITPPFLRDSLYLQLDYSDVTVLAMFNETGFEFTPFQVLAPGRHTLVVTFFDDTGLEYTKEFQFTTRHSESFETAYSQNTVSGQYQRIIHKAGDAEERDVSRFEAQANINTQNLAEQGKWEVSFSSNARYLDQELPLTDPLEKGLDLVDFLLKTQYQSDQYTAGLELGDISLSGTRYTYNGLARRGGKARVDAGNLSLTGFTVRSDQVYGLDSEWGLSFENDDHLHGGAATLRLLDQRMEITLAHIRGETTDNSYGIWSSDTSGVKGKASGLCVKTDFFDQKAQTVLELGWSEYDEDTGDSIGDLSDGAFFAEVSGMLDRFNYRVSWEENGSHYQVPGNSSIISDRKGGQINAGYSFEYQTLSVAMSQYENNLDHDTDRAVIDTDDYRVDYSFSKFSSFPMSLNFCSSVQESSNEPTPWDEMYMVTETWSGNISYVRNQWTFSLSPGYSTQNDRTANDYDTDNGSVTFSTSYSAPKCMVSGSVMYNESTFLKTDVDTRTTTYNLFFKWDLLEHLSLEGSASLSQQEASDDSSESDYWNGDVQLCYDFESPFWGILSPKLMLKASYNGSKDRIYGLETDGALIYLMLTGDLQLSF